MITSPLHYIEQGANQDAVFGISTRKKSGIVLNIMSTLVNDLYADCTTF